MEPSFDALNRRYPWSPIRGCPGRQWLSPFGTDRSLDAWLTQQTRAEKFSVETAADPVWVLPLSEGGLISYKKEDGRFLHTLADAAGFERKLTELGIVLRGDGG